MNLITEPYQHSIILLKIQVEHSAIFKKTSVFFVDLGILVSAMASEQDTQKQPLTQGCFLIKIYFSKPIKGVAPPQYVGVLPSHFSIHLNSTTFAFSLKA